MPSTATTLLSSEITFLYNLIFMFYVAYRVLRKKRKKSCFPRNSSVLNSLVNAKFVRWCLSQIFEICLRILLLVWFEHILVNPPSFEDIPIWVSLLFKTPLRTASQALKKSFNSRSTAPLYSHFFTVPDQCRILDQEPQQWCSITSFTYGINLGRRMHFRVW